MEELLFWPILLGVTLFGGLAIQNARLFDVAWLAFAVAALGGWFLARAWLQLLKFGLFLVALYLLALMIWGDAVPSPDDMRRWLS